MTKAPGPRHLGLVHHVLAVAGTLLLLAMAYAAWAAYLAFGADEGALPPRSRDPAIPSDARVAGETKECASGGCWRQVVLHPAPGKSPEDLAAEMGVATQSRQSWRLLDPHSVTVTSRVVGDELAVQIQY